MNRADLAKLLSEGERLILRRVCPTYVAYYIQAKSIIQTESLGHQVLFVSGTSSYALTLDVLVSKVLVVNDTIDIGQYTAEFSGPEVKVQNPARYPRAGEPWITKNDQAIVPFYGTSDIISGASSSIAFNPFTGLWGSCPADNKDLTGTMRNIILRSRKTQSLVLEV